MVAKTKATLPVSIHIETITYPADAYGPAMTTYRAKAYCLMTKIADTGGIGYKTERQATVAVKGKVREYAAAALKASVPTIIHATPRFVP